MNNRRENMVFEKLVEIISDKLGIEASEIKMSTTFDDDLGVDSLDLFEIITLIEEEYDIEFQVEDTDKMKTVEDCVKFIESTIAE